jgi:hypothetical protein
MEGNTELLSELHALSSGLKSVVSWETAQVKKLGAFERFENASLTMIQGK